MATATVSVSSATVFICLINLVIGALKEEVFDQSLYDLSAPSCNPGTYIGNVNAKGATGYSSSNLQFKVSPSGIVTNLSYLTPGVYAIYVTSIGGTTATVPVTITASCSGIDLTGSFLQQSYHFKIFTCAADTPVGNVHANGAYIYIISDGKRDLFSVSSTGMIKTINELSSGTYFLQITAYGASTANVPVTLTVICKGGATTNWNQNQTTINKTS
jgi:hypothetical protein